MSSFLSRFSGKWTPAAIFVVTLLAFVAESQLTQYVQTTLQYQQPYFLFYIVHSSFSISYPCHLLYLKFTKPYTSSQLWQGVKLATANRIRQNAPQSSRNAEFPLASFIYLILALTAGLTVPSLLWFAAIAIASVTDVTAIWNTNAFFAYLFSVKVFGLKWEARRLGAVVLATIGVIAVVYGGSSGGPSGDTSTSSTSTAFTAPKSAALAGDLLTLVGSVGYAAYQVFYKKYAALASDPDPEGLHDDYERLPAHDDPAYNHVEQDVELSPPFGLYSNFVTTCIGLCTLVLLWIPIPFLHWSGSEPFALPPNWTTTGAIAGIALTGSIFNAGFMILLGLWGPIITSVGGLLTIVLVFISDVLLGATEALTAWSVLGSATIIAAFGVLAYDMVKRE
ncbi:hypothetical protein VNI00_001605 [Paramarasmius palmivorus]|uniref:EamA domain-containing protein n=1 Tax=Paramarasmius palmivorus TaxID=297713 RepID=A0AAW0E3A4_9AGAR